MVRIHQQVLDTIVSHARAESPRECCGLLIARNGDIIEAVPATNVAAEPRRRYEIAPEDYFHQIKRCRAEGLAVVGAYHSHLAGAAVPSETDAAEAFGNFLFVIAGPVNAPAVDVRGYELRENRLRAVALQIAS